MQLGQWKFEVRAQVHFLSGKSGYHFAFASIPHSIIILDLFEQFFYLIMIDNFMLIFGFNYVFFLMFILTSPMDRMTKGYSKLQGVHGSTTPRGLPAATQPATQPSTQPAVAAR